jgi:hypothetical protein
VKSCRQAFTKNFRVDRKEKKMNGRFWLRALLMVILVAALVGVGVWIYNAGAAQGMLASGKIVLPGGGPVPSNGTVPYMVYPYFYRPWGFGFWPIGLFFGLLFFLFLVIAIRGLFFRGFYRRGWHGYGAGRWGDGPGPQWKENVPPFVEEWHRKMHEQPEDASTGQP